MTKRPELKGALQPQLQNPSLVQKQQIYKNDVTKAQPIQERSETKPKKKTKEKRSDREDIEIMRNLLNLAQHKNMFKSNSKDSLRLDFSHTIHNSYYGHKMLAKGIIFNKNTNCFTTYNDKAIHVWHPMTSEKLFSVSFDAGANASEKVVTKDKSKEPSKRDMYCRQISCLCYSTKYHLYFCCMRNFNLIVFNEYLNMIVEIPLRLRLVTECMFIEEKQQLICAGLSGCFLVQMQIRYGYDPRQAILLDPKGNSTHVQVELFSKNFNADEQDQIRVWLEKHKKEESSKNFYVELNSKKDLSKMDKLLEIIEEKGSEYQDHLKFLGLGQWVKGIRLFADQGFFVAWNDESVNFYESDTNCSVLSTIPIASYTDMMTSKDDFVTDVLIYSQLKYILVASNYGNIRVFKWNPKEKTKKIIQTLKGHTRSITSLMIIKPKKSRRITTKEVGKAIFQDQDDDLTQCTCVSASLDGSIRIWCLEKLIELYNFNIINDGNGGGVDETIKRIQLIDDKIFAVFMKSYKNRIDIGQISHLAQSYFISKSKIQIMNKAFTNYPNMQMNRTESLMISFDNNSILMLWPDDGLIKSTIYPPPTPTSITQVIFCMAIQRVFVLLESGNLCVYKVNNRETATLDKLQFAKDFKDYEGKSLSQKITAMNIISVAPPKTDCEILSEIHKYIPKQAQDSGESSDSNQESSDLLSEVDFSPNLQKEKIVKEYEKRKQLQNNDSFLIVGLESGAIIFVDVHSLEHIYARFSVHRHKIVTLKEMRERKLVFSLCGEHKLHIWGFEHEKIKIYKSYNTQRPLNMMQIFQNNVLFNFNAGETVLCVWKSNIVSNKMHEESDGESPNNKYCELVSSKLQKQNEHEDRVLSFDVHYEKQIIVSSDSDGLIKIWDFQMTLLREIKFTEAITAVGFLNNNGDLMAGHGGKLSRIQAENYLPGEYLVKHHPFKHFEIDLNPYQSTTTTGSMPALFNMQPIKKKPEVQVEQQISLDDYFLQLKLLQDNQTLSDINTTMLEQNQDSTQVGNLVQKRGKKDDMNFLINAKLVNGNQILKNLAKGRSLKDQVSKTQRSDAQGSDISKFDFQLNVQVLEEAKKEHYRMQQKNEVSAHEQSYMGKQNFSSEWSIESKPKADANAQFINQLRCGNTTALPPKYMDEKLNRKKEKQEAKRVKTRRQITEDRIVHNIKKCNDPSGISNSLFDLQLMGTQAASTFSQFTQYNDHPEQSESAMQRQKQISEVLSRRSEDLDFVEENQNFSKNSQNGQQQKEKSQTEFSPEKTRSTYYLKAKMLVDNRITIPRKILNEKDMGKGYAGLGGRHYMVQTLAPSVNRNQNFKMRRQQLLSANAFVHNYHEGDRGQRLKAFLSQGSQGTSSIIPMSQDTGISTTNVRQSITGGSMRQVKNQRYNSASFYNRAAAQAAQQAYEMKKKSVPLMTGYVSKENTQNSNTQLAASSGQNNIDPRFHVDIRNKQQKIGSSYEQDMNKSNGEFLQPLSISGIMSNTQTAYNTFNTEVAIKGKSPYSAVGRSRGAVANREMAKRYVKNTVFSAKTRQEGDYANQMGVFGEQKITIQNWSKQKDDKPEISYRPDLSKEESRLGPSKSVRQQIQNIRVQSSSEIMPDLKIHTQQVNSSDRPESLLRNNQSSK